MQLRKHAHNISVTYGLNVCATSVPLTVAPITGRMAVKGMRATHMHKPLCEIELAARTAFLAARVNVA